MSVLGAQVSLASSAWTGHGSSHLCSSPKPFPSQVQCGKTVAPFREVSAVCDGERGDLLPSAEQSFCGSFRREGAQKTVHTVTASASVAEPYSDVQEEDVIQEPVVAPDTDLKSIRVWELDFCSRPILDARGKRIWELLICDTNRDLKFAKFFPNNVINSVTLKDAMLAVMQLGLPKPEKIRFFRSQMANIVTKACIELDIQAVPSRRCFSLLRWLEERHESVYRKYPGFQESSTPLMQPEETLPAELPDNLRGERWAFVQLPIAGVMEEVTAVEKGTTFGSVFSLEVLGIDLPPNAVIPGVAVASARATPLAAWTNALELASLKVNKQKSCLVLSSGCLEQWIYAYYQKSRKSDQEADAWEASKRLCGGLHFLAVQKSLDSDICIGFWLLYDGPQSRI